MVTEEIWHPEIEWHASEGFGVLHGRAAVLCYLKDFADHFDDWQIVPVELIDTNDESSVSSMRLQPGRQTGRMTPRHEGA